jgi:16S rRNA (adenine1518-N6/adenine1519-N6)-dimethyltransferase
MAEDRSLSLKQELLRASQRFNIQLTKTKGQCILIDDNIANFMVNKLDIQPGKDVILEIGPGFGVLTEKLILHANKVVCIEMDAKFCEYLKEKFKSAKNLEIIQGDALKIDFPSHTKLISNVPYQISGPLLEKMASQYDSKNMNPQQIILMLQNEFIDKMMSPPQAKNYGRLSVSSQLLFTLSKLKKVPHSVFFPEPAVESGIVELVPKHEILNIFRTPENLSIFLAFLSGIFPYKNKTVKNTIQLFLNHIESNPTNYNNDLISTFTPLLKDKSCSFLKIDSSKRLWQLSPQEIMELFIKIINIPEGN